ncbi:hypothetical protein GLX27_003374 [Malassezia furfur]|uniref:Rab-GAP TBC domain-containing protein n=1 Tax=Malassezia furfur TaxID=55194 RepID=A0ABY8ET67_MALFU|nr:hypothetical protein CBS14141_003006 [Malassezia furfur]WFD48704.1 hypothetical protein GLX27_003374 [Malassezia furfur]
MGSDDELDAPGNFVDVELNDEPEIPDTPTNASVVDLGSSLRTSYKRGPRWWKSQVTIGADDAAEVHAPIPAEAPAPAEATAPPSPELHNSEEPLSPRPRRHSISGFSNVLGVEDTTASPGFAYRVSSTPVHDARLASDSAFSSTPVRRKAEGRYRSRLEQPMPRPSLLRLSARTPEPLHMGVNLDPTLEPGVSMTVADETGELYVVRSPKPKMISGNMLVPPLFSSQMDRALSRLEHSRFARSESTLAHTADFAPVKHSALHESAHADEHDTSFNSTIEHASPTKQRGTDLKTAQLPVEPPAEPEPQLADTPKTATTPSMAPVTTPAPAPAGASAPEAPTIIESPPAPAATAAATATANASVSADASADKSGSGSLTRMPHLPPKSRKEEARHLADFRAMMQRSKEAEKKREEERAALQRKKDEEAEQMRRVWDQEILPCWTRARQEQKYQALWWQGIPQPLRARLWPRAAGNNLMLPHDLFARASREAKSALAQGRFPEALCAAIDAEVSATLPSLRLFDHAAAPMHDDLRDVLYAYVFLRADEACQRLGSGVVDLASLDELFVLYVPGSASLAAMLLLNLPAPHAFLALLNLVASKAWLKAIYQLDRPQAQHPDVSRGSEPVGRQAQAFERVFNTLMAEQMPTVYANLHKAGIRTSDYVRPWIRTLFVPWLDIDTAMRVWDVMLLDESGAVLFRVALALVQLLEPRLYEHDRNELLSVLRGTNAGALHVWHRSLPDGAEEGVPRDRIYAQYCIDEAALFQVLDEQKMWWRDNTLRRLLDRELR